MLSDDSRAVEELRLSQPHRTKAVERLGKSEHSHFAATRLDLQGLHSSVSFLGDTDKEIGGENLK